MKNVQAEISPLMEELSSYIAGAIKKPLPPEVVERAKVHLVDTFAAIISGSRLLPGKKALAYVKSLGGKPVASVFGSRIVTSAPNAAFANGMCAHADETDDGHPPTRTHPGSGTVPAVIAIGRRDGNTGDESPTRDVLGYDIGARLILTITELHFRNTGHQPSILRGLFSAAVAAERCRRTNSKWKYGTVLCRATGSRDGHGIAGYRAHRESFCFGHAAA